MPKIPIITAQKKPLVPASPQLNTQVARCKAPGGKPPLPLRKSFSPVGKMK